jgi:hypothetical protein
MKFESHNLASAQTAWALVGIDALVQIGHERQPHYQVRNVSMDQYLGLFAFRRRSRSMGPQLSFLAKQTTCPRASERAARQPVHSSQP